jgi:hypothetical protein
VAAGADGTIGGIVPCPMAVAHVPRTIAAAGSHRAVILCLRMMIRISAA